MLADKQVANQSLSLLSKTGGFALRFIPKGHCSLYSIASLLNKLVAHQSLSLLSKTGGFALRFTDSIATLLSKTGAIQSHTNTHWIAQKCAEIGLALNKKQFLDVDSHLKSIRMVANKMIKLFFSEKIENKELMARIYGFISVAHEVVK